MLFFVYLKTVLYKTVKKMLKNLKSFSYVFLMNKKKFRISKIQKL